MRTSIKINDQYIQKILLGSTPVQRIYQSGSIVYEAGGSTPCFEVVDTISEASGDYVDVYALDTEKWYKRNNLNQYEEYGVMEHTDDLSELTYYTGKLVILDTTNHEYKWNGSQWVDLGECEFTTIHSPEYISRTSSYTGYVPLGDKFQENTVIEIDFQMTNDRGYAVIGDYFGNDNDDWRFFVNYSNGGYNGVNYDFDTTHIQTKVSNTKARFHLEIGNYYVKYYGASSNLITGTRKTNFNRPNQMYLFHMDGPITQVNEDYGNVYMLKITQDGVLSKDFIPWTDMNGNYGFYDLLSNTVYPSTGNITGSNNVTDIQIGGGPIEDYPTKVAPANNVHYNTLAELELMECPWNGMQATVGANNDLYFYWNNQWTPIGSPCIEVVETISEATGTYLDVYCTGNSKWYKKNNLNQYEEYGVMPTVSDLSGVTTYTGKLVILSTDSHEYKWNGSEWIDLGECSGSGTPTGENLPEFAFNYNVKNMSGNTFVNLSAGTEGNSNVIPSSVFTKYDDYITLNSAALVEIPNTSGKLNRTNSDPTFTVIMKVKPTATDTANLLCNRSTDYNWMVRPYSSKYTLHGRSETGSISVSNSTPNIVASVVGSDRTIKYYNITNGTTSQTSSFSYGGITSSNVTLFSGYQNQSSENYYGDLYWVYVSKLALTQEQINDVVSLNENWTAFEPVEDYTPKAAPPNDVHYDTLVELLISECPYIGMTATVGQDYTVYVYTEDGWVLGDLPLDLPYLRFTATENTEITFSQDGLDYSINGGVWKTMAANVAASVPASSYIIFKGECTPTSEGIGTFSATGKFNVSGNIMSLLFGDDFTDKVSLAGKNYAFHKLFLNNTKVVDATNLVMPATTLSDSCYRRFFSGCSSLNAVSQNLLPATTLTNYCYSEFFSECSSLTTSPLLPATNLAPYCYHTMYQSCRLSKLPELPATIMVEHCYDTMFNYVSTNIPDNYLPSTQLAPYCYVAMFANASSSRSKTMSILPATTLASHCYDTMFINNRVITEAPILPAETLVTGCYNNMLYGCGALRKVIAKFTTTPSSSYTNSWLHNHAATFYKNPNATWDQTISRNTSTVPDQWTITDISSTENYLKFTTVDDNGSTYAFSKSGLEYSIDGGAWTTLAANTNTPNVPKDSNIRFRGYLTPSGSQGIGTFTSSGKFDAEGDLMTLLYGEYYVGQTGKFANYMFKDLFMNSNVVDAANIILPNVSYNYLYQNTFRNCVYLTSSPAMPAASCNWRMYSDTYNGCTSLVNVGKISAYNTSSTEGACGMFKNCTSLVSSPVIIMNAQVSAFYQLFDGCSNLSEVTYLGTTSPSSSNSNNWLRNVAATGTFYMNQNATWDQTVPRNVDGVPAGWTIVKIDPTSV